MRTRVFTSMAICAVALGLAGCRVQSTLVMPNGATLPYAAPGEILEWRPSVGQAGTIYVNFNGAVPPCAARSYPIGPNKAARCEVLKDHGGYFSYYFSPRKPDPKHLFARSCPYCQIYVGSGNSGSAGPSVAEIKENGGSKNGISYPPLLVGCDDNGNAVVENPIPNGVQDQDQIYWVPSSTGKSVTVTVPDNMCTGGTNGVFAADQICTVSGLPSTSGQPPITYTYQVKVDNCKQAPSTLTINPPSAP